MVGVLGSSRSTTGASASGRGSGRAGPPQARYLPPGPDPQSDSRRTTDRTRADRRAAGAATGAADGRATRQARCSPRGPLPHNAARRSRPESPRTGARSGSGSTWARGEGVGRASGAGCTERSGRVRPAPAWAEVRRDCGRRPAAPPSARSRTSISPARLRPCPRRAGSAGMRAAVSPSPMSPPRVTSATGEAAADKEKGRDRRPVPEPFPTRTEERVTEPLHTIFEPAGDPFLAAGTCRQTAHSEREDGRNGGRSFRRPVRRPRRVGAFTPGKDAELPSRNPPPRVSGLLLVVVLGRGDRGPRPGLPPRGPPRGAV